MAGQQSFTPDYVFNLVRGNPEAQRFIESLAAMNQMKQYVPQVNQFIQNPMQGMQAVGDWAQGAVNQMNSPTQGQPNSTTTPPNTQAETQSAQGGNQMNPMSMAMDIVAEFKTAFKLINDNMKEMYDMNTSLVNEVKELRKVCDAQRSELTTFVKTFESND